MIPKLRYDSFMIGQYSSIIKDINGINERITKKDDFIRLNDFVIFVVNLFSKYLEDKKINTLNLGIDFYSFDILFNNIRINGDDRPNYNTFNRLFLEDIKYICEKYPSAKLDLQKVLLKIYEKEKVLKRRL